MRCGHCGTEVPDGYEVCTGCGARYTIRKEFIGWGNLFVLAGLFYLISVLHGTQNEYVTFVGLLGLHSITVALFALGILSYRRALKKVWRRSS